MTSDKETPSALLIFSIGPVQDFIATARRTQDLWMGSYILSYLTASALNAVVGNPPNLEMILYPTLSEQPLVDKLILQSPNQPPTLTLATLPNKFTAQVASVEVGKQLAQQAEQAVYSAWLELSQSIADKFPGSLARPTDEWQALWKKQALPQRWIEVYWVVYPGTGYSYGDLNRRAEQALMARKSSRNFGAADEYGEKCTVCGSRAALGSKPEQPRTVLRAEWKHLAEQLSTQSEAGHPDYRGLTAALSREGNERLCVICASKRFAQRFFFEEQIKLQGGFPSTSSIATVVFRRDVMQTLPPSTREIFLAALSGEIPPTLAAGAFPALERAYPNDQLLTYDGNIFYSETYTAKRLKDDYGLELTSEEDIRLQRLRQALADLRRAAADAKITLPPKYYAVLLMDGDRMGDCLRKADSVDTHRRLSNGLRDFALKQVQAIIEDQALGRVVYAGGDDLLAFLPLEYVFDAARKLNKAFHALMPDLTLSTGIAIAHHLAPLDGVLKAARRAEEEAKETYKRDAVVVTVLKRSGEQLDVGARWDYDSLDVLDLITKVRNAFQGQDANGNKVQLSPKFAYEAEGEARALAGVPRDAYRKMLERLLNRHGQGLENPSLASQLAELRAGLSGHLRPDMPATLETARWLLLARFLASAREE